MYRRLSLSCLVIIIYITSTALAKSNGAPRPGSIIPRHHKRRAIGLSEFLTPPAMPIHRNRLSPPSPQHLSSNNPYRHGKILNPPPQHPVPPAESPGYFSQFMSWLNPFSGRSHSSSPPVQPLPPPRLQNYNQIIQNVDLKPPPFVQAPQYTPPAEHALPKPPSPPTGQSYSPPLSASNCNTCNTVPWIPMPQAVNIHQSSGPSQNNLPHNNENIALTAPAPSYEVKQPDFGYGPPQLQHETIPQASHPHQNIDTSIQYTSVFTGPIPNPHLYPGAIPPLFKATAFNAQSGDLNPIFNHEQTSAGINSQLNPDNSNHREINLNQHQNQSYFQSTSSDNVNSAPGYVDVLPPSAEVVSGPEHFLPSEPAVVHQDNGGSSSNFEHVLHSTNVQENLSASSQSIVDIPTPTECPQASTNHNNNQRNSYGTKLSSDGQHFIHIEESPVIDLSTNDDKTNDASVSSSQSLPVIEESSVILQNFDGTYGINATMPNNNNSSYIDWPLDSETENDSTASTPLLSERKNNEKIIRIPVVEVDQESLQLNKAVTSQGTASQNVSSLLLGVFRNTHNLTEPEENLYVGYSGTVKVNTQENNLEIDSGSNSRDSYYSSSTEEPFLEALVESNNGFKRQETEAKRSRLQFDSQDLHPGASFTPSFGVTDSDESNQEFKPVNMKNVDDGQVDPQRGVKRNKQVQIIIPYTSQYTPSPFHPSREFGSIEKIDKSQGRKVPELNENDNVEDTRNGIGGINNLSHILQAQDRPKVKDVTIKSNNVKANTSIDVLRLQKNIDNWTIQEYSKGTTVSTISPISSYPHLLQSKKIPEEYFTTTEPVSVSGTIREIEKTYGNVLAGFNYNDLEHEGSASSRVDTPNIRVSSYEREDPSMSSELDSTATPTATTTNSLSVSSAEDDSWEQLPVSISPLSNERVYVVTPQSVLKSSHINSNTKINDDTQSVMDTSNNTAEKFESIERAYQVLPEAVNNLAVASTGPATIPLWGIMEHEQYALPSNKSNNTVDSPILYSGHSKVSHTRQ